MSRAPASENPTRRRAETPKVEFRIKSHDHDIKSLVAAGVSGPFHFQTVHLESLANTGTTKDECRARLARTTMRQLPVKTKALKGRTRRKLREFLQQFLT